MHTHYTVLQGRVSISDTTSYRKVSWSLKAARLIVGIITSLWNLTGASAEVSVKIQSDRIIRNTNVGALGFSCYQTFLTHFLPNDASRANPSPGIIYNHCKCHTTEGTGELIKDFDYVMPSDFFLSNICPGSLMWECGLELKKTHVYSMVLISVDNHWSRRPPWYLWTF